MGRYGIDAAVISYKVNGEANGWRDINDSTLWQDRIFHILAAVYFLVPIFTLVQLIRIHLRVLEFGWTTQKVFHLLNFLVNGDCSTYLSGHTKSSLLHDICTSGFVLAEIYYQVRAESTDGLRPIFFVINVVVYTIQIAMWLVLWWKYIPVLVIISKMFFAVGGDITFNFGPFHFAEVATKTRYYPVSSDTLIFTG